MCFTMNNAGPDGAILLILLAVVILQRHKVVNCVQFYWTRDYFLKTKRHLQQLLHLALEHIKNCQYEVSFIALGCLDGQSLVRKFTMFDRVCMTAVTYQFSL